jgi:hypothetical protein
MSSHALYSPNITAEERVPIDARTQSFSPVEISLYDFIAMVIANTKAKVGTLACTLFVLARSREKLHKVCHISEPFFYIVLIFTLGLACSEYKSTYTIPKSGKPYTGSYFPFSVTPLLIQETSSLELLISPFKRSSQQDKQDIIPNYDYNDYCMKLRHLPTSVFRLSQLTEVPANARDSH